MPTISRAMFHNRISVIPSRNLESRINKEISTVNIVSSKPSLPPSLIHQTNVKKNEVTIGNKKSDEEESRRGTRRLYEKNCDKSDSPSAQRHTNYDCNQEQKWYFVALDNEYKKKVSFKI